MLVYSVEGEWYARDLDVDEARAETGGGRRLIDGRWQDHNLHAIRWSAWRKCVSRSEVCNASVGRMYRIYI